MHPRFSEMTADGRNRTERRAFLARARATFGLGIAVGYPYNLIADHLPKWIHETVVATVPAKGA